MIERSILCNKQKLKINKGENEMVSGTATARNLAVVVSDGLPVSAAQPVRAQPTQHTKPVHETLWERRVVPPKANLIYLNDALREEIHRVLDFMPNEESYLFVEHGPVNRYTAVIVANPRDTSDPMYHVGIAEGDNPMQAAPAAFEEALYRKEGRDISALLADSYAAKARMPDRSSLGQIE
jgi:hypothetical protein